MEWSPPTEYIYFPVCSLFFFQLHGSNVELLHITSRFFFAFSVHSNTMISIHLPLELKYQFQWISLLQFSTVHLRVNCLLSETMIGP